MLIKVRIEETAIGALLGAAVAIVCTSPFTCGLGSFSPFGGDFADTFQAALLWVSALSGGAAGAWYASRQEAEHHVRGVRYEADTAKAIALLDAQERDKMSDRQHPAKQAKDAAAPRVQGLVIGGVELSRSRETEHVVVSGLPGAGKTVLLKAIIDQVRERGDRLLIHDPKNDLLAMYYDASNTVLLGLWDERSHLWDIGADIDSPALAKEFAKTVCGVASANGESKFFDEAAAGVLAGILLSFTRNGERLTWAALGAILSRTPAGFVSEAAIGDPRVAGDFAFLLSPLSGGVPNKQEQSVLSTLKNATDWLLQVAAVDTEGKRMFSMRGWLTGKAHSDVRTVILNNNAMYKAAGGAIFGSVLAVMAETVNSALMPEVSADDPGIWMVLDEFPQLGAGSIVHIQNIAELGRSRGVREVLALQEESQITALLGRDKAEPVLKVQRTRVYMAAEANFAAEVAQRIGKRDILLIETTAQNGALQGKTMRADSRDVLNPSDLLGLKVTPDGPLLLLHIGDVIGQLVQPFGPRCPNVAEPFIESQAWKFGAMPKEAPAPAGAANPVVRLFEAANATLLTMAPSEDAPDDEEWMEAMAQSDEIPEPDVPEQWEPSDDFKDL